MSTANGRRPDNRKDMSREANGLEFPLGESKPDAAETIEIAPGVHWLRMPLPFQLNHINLWLLEDGDGFVIVDTGMQLDETKQHWLAIFDRFGIAHGGKPGRPVTRLIVTHFHPDHIGLGGWLTELLDTELWITRTEWLMARMLYLDSDSVNHRSMAEFFAKHGLAQANWRTRCSPAATPIASGSPRRPIITGACAPAISWKSAAGAGRSSSAPATRRNMPACGPPTAAS